VLSYDIDTAISLFVKSQDLFWHMQASFADIPVSFLQIQFSMLHFDIAVAIYFGTVTILVLFLSKIFKNMLSVRQ